MLHVTLTPTIEAWPHFKFGTAMHEAFFANEFHEQNGCRLKQQLINTEIVVRCVGHTVSRSVARASSDQLWTGRIHGGMEHGHCMACNRSARKVAKRIGDVLLCGAESRGMNHFSLMTC